MSGESIYTTNLNSGSSTMSTTEPKTWGLQTYNSAADLTEQQPFILDKNEFLFDVNTSHSCVRPLRKFITLLSKSNVPREFASFTSLSLTRIRTVDRYYDHVSLCKYNEMIVYEQTRVRVPHKNGHDFINASWIDGFREIRKYIVTQSPLRATIGQFYRMVYDRRSHVIVSFVELIDDQGSPFVPRKSGETLRFENMSVELVSMRQIIPSYYSATIKVTKEGSDPKTVVLLAYNGWGSTGYPNRPSDILNIIIDMNNMREMFRKKMLEENSLEEKQTFPITLICFDGLSRSCTLAALDILCQRLEASSALGSPYVDVMDTIARLRMLRAGACPKAELYMFLSMAVLQFAISRRIVAKEALEGIDFPGFIMSGSPDNDSD